jgi:hypothetical protein
MVNPCAGRTSQPFSEQHRRPAAPKNLATHLVGWIQFNWNDKVCQITKPEIEAIVDDFFWHHKDEKYLYQISVGGKRMSNRYDENDLKLVSQS